MKESQAVVITGVLTFIFKLNVYKLYILDKVSVLIIKIIIVCKIYWYLYRYYKEIVKKKDLHWVSIKKNY